MPSQQTSQIGLIKPVITDTFSLDILNTNNDKIDNNVYNLIQRVETLEATSNNQPVIDGGTF